MAETEEKGWWDLLWSGEFTKAWDAFAESAKSFFSKISNMLSGFFSRSVDEKVGQSQEAAQQVIDKSREQGIKEGQEAAKAELKKFRDGDVTKESVQEAAGEAFTEGQLQGRLREAIAQRKAGELTPEQYEAYIATARESAKEGHIPDHVLAQLLEKELKAQGIDPAQWSAEKITKGTLAFAEISTGTFDNMVGTSVVIQGDLTSKEAALLQKHEKDITAAFTALYETGKPPAGLTFEQGKWKFTKGEETVEIDPAAVTIATSRSEGLGYLDGDPRSDITRVREPKLNAEGQLVFGENQRFEIKDLGANKIGGKRTGGSQLRYSMAILNDEIATLVASDAFKSGEEVTVRDNDIEGVEPHKITIVDIKDGSAVTPSVPVRVQSEADRTAVPGGA